MASAEYLAFLDERIPELHAMGKPERDLSELSIPERVSATAANMAAARYPGVLARLVADLEWGQRKVKKK